jgi:hypothetical protein
MRPAKILCAVILCLLTLQAQARPEIKFSCPIPESLPQWADLIGIYTEAFDTLGYDFSMVYLNTKREIFNHIHNNEFDGICIRGKSFLESAKEHQLFMIESPVGSPVISLWRHKASTPPPGDQPTILEANTRVGYLRGGNRSLDYINSFADVTPVSFLRPDLGIKSLAAGRINYWIGFSYTSDHLSSKLNLGDAIERVATIEQRTFYPYLHERHRTLKAAFEKEISRIMSKRHSLVK